jgi:hypothetical protein
MIYLILYFVIAFVTFIALLCWCCITYKKIDNPYQSFESWMRIHENWNIIPFSILWIVFLPLFIVFKLTITIVNLVLKCFDIEPIKIL